MIATDVSLADVIGFQSGLAALCRRVDPTSVPLPDAPAMWEAFAAIEKLAAGAKLRLASRVEESGKWRSSGCRSAEEWMARKAGTSVGSAKEACKTSKRLKAQPGTDEALKNGDLSEDQANTVSDAAEANPDAEQSLLGQAKHGNRKKLREAAGRAKADADPDPEATHRRHHKARSARTWRDSEGMFNLLLRHTPEFGAEFEAIFALYRERTFAEARRQGRHEPSEAYDADAVADIIRAAAGQAPAAGHSPGGGPASNGPAPSSGPDAPQPPAPTSPMPGSASKRPDGKVLAFIELSALLNGKAEPGDRCEIAGIGPVPATSIRAMLGEAALAVIVTDGKDILSICHLGRQVTAHQRTALEARGYECAVPGCGISRHLHIDHVTGWNLTHDTVLDDLEWLCAFHHDQKTHRGYRWQGDYHHRQWVHPDGTEHAVRAEPAEPRAGPPPRAGPSTHGAEPGEPNLFGPPAA